MNEIDSQGMAARIARKFSNRVMIVELTNHCNLRCPLCSTGSGLNRKPKGFMDVGQYRRFLDQVWPLVDTVIFSGSGEPLLHPQFAEFVAYAAREKGRMATCLTNGTQLTSVREIVESGLTKLQVDVNGLTQEEHARYRVGANLEAVLNNIRELMRARATLRSDYPLVYLDVLLSRHNEADYGRFISLARELGVNGVILTAMVDDFGHGKDWLPRGERFRPRPRRFQGCVFQHTLVGILSWDGDIQLCCMAPNRTGTVSRGNGFRSESLLGWMDSDEFLRIARHCGAYACCAGCSLCESAGFAKTISFHLPWGFVARKFLSDPGRIIAKALRGGFGWV